MNFQPLARRSQRAYRTNLIFALDIPSSTLPRIPSPRDYEREEGVLKPRSERKILVEASRARFTPKKMWKKRKEIGNESRGVRARSREKIAILFFVHLEARLRLLPRVSPKLSMSRLPGRTTLTFIVLLSNMVNARPGHGQHLAPCLRFLPVCFPPNDFRPVDFDTMISTHAVGIGYVIVSIREDRLRNCIAKIGVREFCEIATFRVF